MARRFHALMTEVELDPRHFALMRAISLREGQSQNVLADALDIPASSMVSLVDHLESRGLVVRHLHPSDRRARTLHMTDEGARLLARATEMAWGLEEQICRGLDASERQVLIDRLRQIGANLGVIPGVHPDVAAGQGAPLWVDDLGSAARSRPART